MKRNTNRLFIILTLFMIGLVWTGIYGILTAQVKAKAAMAEAEEKLKAAQKKAEKKKQEILAQQEKAKLNEIAGKARDELIPEDVTTEMLQKRYEDSSDMYVTGIGDSVMLAATDALYAQFPNAYIDAVFGSTIFECTDRLIDLENKNMLGDVVVLSVGANSYISAEDCEKIIANCAGRPTFWLTTYGVSNDSNEVMEGVVAQHDDAWMIDWESEAMPHPEWILDDHLHPNDEGSKAYAELIRSEINKDLGLKGKQS